jgi:hypothetical protein
MPVVRPFRALRPDARRSALERLVCFADATPSALTAATRADPRHVGRLWRGGSAAAFVLVDLVRAGVVVLDARPTLTVVRATRDGTEHTHLYGALATDDDDLAGPAVPVDAPPVGDVVVEPVLIHYVDKRGRILKAIEAETEREPDASFALDGKQLEVWAVDDESAAARIAGLLEAAPLTLDAASAGTWAALRAAQVPRAVASFSPTGGESDVTVAPVVGLAMLAHAGALASRDQDV